MAPDAMNGYSDEELNAIFAGGESSSNHGTSTFSMQANRQTNEQQHDTGGSGAGQSYTGYLDSDFVNLNENNASEHSAAFAAGVSAMATNHIFGSGGPYSQNQLQMPFGYGPYPTTDYSATFPTDASVAPPSLQTQHSTRHATQADLHHEVNSSTTSGPTTTPAAATTSADALGVSASGRPLKMPNFPQLVSQAHLENGFDWPPSSTWTGEATAAITHAGALQASGIERQYEPPQFPRLVPVQSQMNDWVSGDEGYLPTEQRVPFPSVSQHLASSTPMAYLTGPQFREQRQNLSTGRVESFNSVNEGWAYGMSHTQQLVPLPIQGQSSTSLPPQSQLAVPIITVTNPSSQLIPNESWILTSSLSTPFDGSLLDIGGSSSNSGQGSMRQQSDSSWVMARADSDSLDFRISPDSNGPVWVNSTTDKVGSDTSGRNQIGAASRRTAPPSYVNSKDEVKAGNLQIVMYGQKEPPRKRKATGVDLSSTEPPPPIVKYGDDGRVQGVELVLGKSDRKVKGAYDSATKKATACCRDTGACLTCQKGKKRCDLHEKSPYESCSACSSRKRTYKGIPRFPCFLSQMADTVFFRKGPSIGSPQYFGRQSVYLLSSTLEQLELPEPVREVRLLQLSQIHGLKLEVYVTKFKEMPGDKVDCKELNEDGERCVLKMPHYCLTDIEKITSNVQSYIQQTRNNYLKLLRVDKDPSNITWLTAKIAIEYASQNPDSMTSLALNMWAYCRVIEREWKICGEDTLGLTKSTDPKSPWFGFIPITPMMDVQLDQIVIQRVLNPLRVKLVLKLQETIEKHLPGTWFDCYLTMYMLLNHIEWACTHGNRFSKSHGLGRRYSDMQLAESWFHTSKILLSRFHFYSNGSAPFQIDWTKTKNVTYAKLNEDQVQFMQRIQQLVKTKDLHFKDLKDKHRYENDQYWTHQLFGPKWDSGIPHIVDELLS